MQIYDNHSLQSLNSFGVEISANCFTSLMCSADIESLLKWRADNPSVPCLLIGGGSNLLFRDNFPGLAVAVRLMGKQLVKEDENHWYIEAAAGENWHDFVRWTIDQGYAGLENLSLIPGTVGAAPMQNIGAYGVELTDRLHCLTAIDLLTGETREFTNTDCQFGYRDSFFKRQQADRWLISAVVFRLAKQPVWVTEYAGVDKALAGQAPSAKFISDVIIALRQSKLPDPALLGNAGSFFKNPILSHSDYRELKARFADIPGYPQRDGSDQTKTSAAWLIDQCGWKAHRVGDAGIYEKHALVLVNHGSASGQELWGLAEQIIQSVQDKFGIVLEAEPRVITA